MPAPTAGLGQTGNLALFFQFDDNTPGRGLFMEAVAPALENARLAAPMVGIPEADDAGTLDGALSRLARLGWPLLFRAWRREALWCRGFLEGAAPTR